MRFPRNSSVHSWAHKRWAHKRWAHKRWAHKNGELNDVQADEAHRLAEKYIQDIRRELSAVPAILKDVAALPCVEIFALDDQMLDLANELALTNVAQKL